MQLAERALQQDIAARLLKIQKQQDIGAAALQVVKPKANTGNPVTTFENLKKKYNNITANSLKNMIMAIDNNMVYEGNDKKNLLLCDTYNFQMPENLPLTINKNIFESKHNIIMNIITAYFPRLKYTNNYMKFEKQFYTEYISAINDTLKQRSQSSYDILFKSIRNFIIGKNITSFNENILQYLNNKLHTFTNTTKNAGGTRSFF